MQIKRVLATVMTIIMLFGALALSAQAGGKLIDEYSVGDIITFGSYPQSKVRDSSTISALNSKAGSFSSWTSYDYFIGTGDQDDVETQPSDYMKYKDVTYNGAKYRGVYFTSYRPYRTGSASSLTSSAQDDNGYYINTAYWFKYEPLTWRLLDPSEGLAVSVKTIDSQAYQNYLFYSEGECYNSESYTAYASDWSTSSMRQWLNDDFYNTAFSSTEKSQINISSLENKSKRNSEYDGAQTSDKIFLLSYSDVLNSSYGYSESYSEFDTARQLKPTDYALAQGCYKETTEAYNGNSCMLLRTSIDSEDVAVVYVDGDTNYSANVAYTYCGVVPAFRFNPKYFICEHSYTETVTAPTCTEKGYTTHTCSCGDSYVDSFVDALGHAHGEWKTTKQPTLTQAGEKELYCERCLELIKTESIPMLKPKAVHSVKVSDINLNYKKSTTLKPQINADDGVSYTVSYTSSNTKVASVDKNGNVYGAKKGSAEITVTVTDQNGNTVKDSCTVNVKYSFGQWLIIILLFGWIWY